MSRWSFAFGVLVLASLSATPKIAHAQEPCGPLEECAGNLHRIPCPGGAQMYEGCHSECAYCFGPCHPGCQVSLVPGQGDKEAKAYARLLALADDLSTLELIRASAALPGRVLYNPARDAVQVVACDGVSIIASIPLRHRSERLLAQSSLPSTSGITWGAVPVTLVALANVFGPAPRPPR